MGWLASLVWLLLVLSDLVHPRPVVVLGDNNLRGWVGVFFFLHFCFVLIGQCPGFSGLGLPQIQFVGLVSPKSGGLWVVGNKV